jgi:pantothenate kinase-related protein Tda10
MAPHFYKHAHTHTYKSQWSHGFKFMLIFQPYIKNTITNNYKWNTNFEYKMQKKLHKNMQDDKLKF